VALAVGLARRCLRVEPHFDVTIPFC
jgi:hypothetical protein